MCNQEILIYPRTVTLNMKMALYRIEHKMDIYHCDKTCLLFDPSCSTTAHSQTLASHLLLQVCHKLKQIHSKLMVHCWRQNTISIQSFNYMQAIFTLHPNKTATLLWYNVFYQNQHFIFYKVLNTGITPWRWPSTAKIWNTWEKVQYNYIYFISVNILS